MPEVKLIGNITGLQYGAEEPGEGNKRKEPAFVKVTVRASVTDDRDGIVGELAILSRNLVNMTIAGSQGKGSKIKLIGKIKGIQYGAEEPGEDNKRKEPAFVKVILRAPITSDLDTAVGEIAVLSRDLVNVSIVESQINLDAGSGAKKKKDGK